ncbi:recombinase [Pectobacterium carotovorum subsp. carotovorum]|nr:plasmid segregation protein ParM domain-containing protein [Pectobacterium carotovorum]MCL6336332.1 recombinase [Pectobacterium carotovorum subsp. carotovorum]
MSSRTKVFIDDGSTNIKMKWKNGDEVKKAISPSSFKRGWSVAFGSQASFNYTLNGDTYSYDPISSEAVVTTNINYQYSDINVIAVHHALLNSGIKDKEVDIVVTLPLSEFYDRNNQPNVQNINRKRDSLMRPVTLNGGEAFTIRNVDVMPESIPAGYSVAKELEDLDSLLIVDLGGTTLDISHVRAKMRGISKIHGDSSLGVSLITSAVKDALAIARTKGSSYLADEVIINRNNPKVLEKRINDYSQHQMVLKNLEDSRKVLSKRVLEAINMFNGYSHVKVIGGGASLIADDVKNHLDLKPNRFFVSDEPQFDLVDGMFEIG